MADEPEDRLKHTMRNEGVTEIANTKSRTDPLPPVVMSPEINRNAPPAPSSLPQGEKRKAPSGPDGGGGEKKLKPFSMSFGARSKPGVAQGQDVTSKSSVVDTKTAKPVKSVSLKLMQKPKEPELKAPTSRAVAKAFADDSDDDEEEMPQEAKMRMKNVGRETPTSAGPNSYNKSKYGFNDQARVWKKTVDSKTSVEPKK